MCVSGTEGLVVSLSIRAASHRDLKGIVSLLTAFGLPTIGITEHLMEFLVADDAGEVVASAGTEVYGASALLRSVAVRRDYQGRGVARQLVGKVLDRVRIDGVRQVYLLTTTAASYFERLGFVRIPREQVDCAVQASLEFRELCCDTAIAMLLTIGSQRAKEGRTA